MSVKNKSYDRDNNGKITRRYTRKQIDDRWSTTPSWWIRLTMNRPRRRLNRTMCHQVLAGMDADGMAFPLGNHKPHNYYF